MLTKRHTKHTQYASLQAQTYITVGHFRKRRDMVLKTNRAENCELLD